MFFIDGIFKRSVMQSDTTKILFLLLIGVFSIAGPAWSASEKRVALVIGNSEYQKAPLRNPVNDASDVAELLETRLGFTVQKVLNADEVGMRKAIRDFNRTMKDADVRLFYYAGHGVSVGGENFMIPLAADIESEEDVETSAVNTSLVVNLMDKLETGANLVILDACRDNPLPRSTRSAQGGLTKMRAPVGSLILYATAPGQVALDGNGRNGTFTKHLLRSLGAPGVHIGDIALDVRVAVMHETENKQVPWSESSLTRRIYLAGQDEDSEISIATDNIPASTMVNPTEYESSIVMAYSSAAEAGDIVAQARLGYIYDVGRSVSQDNGKAKYWYERAIAGNNLDAKVNLGVMYWNGDGVPVDQDKSFMLFEQAALSGHPVAQRNLGTMYQYGEAVSQNYEKAIYWFQQAATQGNIQSFVDLGDVYSRGLGVPIDESRAFEWYMQAAVQGSAQAQTEVGYYYDKGIGFPQDYSQAFEWFSAAATQNHPTGNYNLAESYELGKGVSVDLIKAKKHYQIAVEFGDSAAIEALKRLSAIDN